jgi:hypothetical protein
MVLINPSRKETGGAAPARETCEKWADGAGEEGEYSRNKRTYLGQERLGGVREVYHRNFRVRQLGTTWSSRLQYPPISTFFFHYRGKTRCRSKHT